MNRQALRGHALTVLATVMGIAGMGMVFSGAMAANLQEISRGLPLLLIGLWWAGRELSRSIDASRTRRLFVAAERQGGSGSVTGKSVDTPRQP
jgi:hypothetical protein